MEKYLCLLEQLFPLKLVHCAEFIPTGQLLNAKGGLCCDPGHCRIGHLARMLASYSCCSLASSNTACILLKYSPCIWTAEFTQAAEVSPECATLTVQTAVPAAANTSGAMRPHSKPIPLTRKFDVVISKSQASNQESNA